MPQAFWTPSTAREAGAYLAVEVKRGGRMQPPNLPDAKLKYIGERMVAAQLDRWSKGVNANGQAAKPLTRRYFFVKKYITGQWRPIRDNNLTGRLVKNFSLRKAQGKVIRAEPTQRLTRMESARCEQYDHMTGFSATDELVVFRSTVEAYSDYVQQAWKPMDQWKRF
jgi:hypothetical protein